MGAGRAGPYGIRFWDTTPAARALSTPWISQIAATLRADGGGGDYGPNSGGYDALGYGTLMQYRIFSPLTPTTPAPMQAGTIDGTPPTQSAQTAPTQSAQAAPTVTAQLTLKARQQHPPTPTARSNNSRTQEQECFPLQLPERRSSRWVAQRS
ncbi:hypothetical protein ACW0JT_03390 [Arthrobacter sp. SA17]